MIPLFAVNMAPGALNAAAEVLRSGYIGQGEKVAEFERLLNVATGGAHWLAVNSCTSAIDLALHLAGARAGDIVVSTAMTCTATNSPIVNRGAKIVWADVSPRTGCIDAEHAVHLAGLYGASAIVAVDWAGRACDYNKLKTAGIPVIQDAAHLSPYDFDPRNRGDYSCLSFQAIKFVTTGDGGALSVPDDQYDRAKLLRWYGLDRESGKSFRCEQDITEVGYKYHMNDVAASIGIENMQTMQALSNRGLARKYWDWLADTGVTAPYDSRCSYWLFCILVPDRDDFISYMADRGIECSPVHARNDKHTAFVDATLWPNVCGIRDGLWYFSEHEVAIPCGSWVSLQQAEYIANCVRAYFGYSKIT